MCIRDRNYTVNFTEQQSGSNAVGDYTLTRTWSAASACGQTAAASQVITVKGSPAISLSSVPTDVTIGCGQAIPSAATVTASDAIGLNYTVNFTEQQSGSNAVGDYTLTRTWSAASACGQTATASQVITVKGSPAISLSSVPTDCLLYTSPSPRDATLSRMPSSA